MKELYPATGAYFREEGNEVIFQAEVNSQFKLLDRQLMSLCDEVIVVYPEALKLHLEQLWSQRSF